VIVGDQQARTIARDVAAMRRHGPYRPPRAEDLVALPALTDAILAGDLTAAARAGASMALAALHVDGGALLLRTDPEGEQSWLTLVLRAGERPEVLVEVPHPNADLHTEEVGLAVHARCPGAVYVQAGAHRVAGAPRGARERAAFPADVAACPDTVFCRLVDALVTARGLPQVQLHGFADRPAAGVDVVLSAGASRPGPLLAAVTSAVRASGERVGTGDDPRWADLQGRRNVAGHIAARTGAAFVHVELSRTLRADPARRAAVATAIADAIAASAVTTSRTHDGGGVPEHPAAVSDP
jgi:hypothetical protein